MQNLANLVGRLIAHGIEFVPVGGYAAVAHGASFVTADLDICLRFTPENLIRLQNSLADLHPKHRMTPQKLPFEITPEGYPGLRNLYLETDCDSGGFDLIFSPFQPDAKSAE